MNDPAGEPSADPLTGETSFFGRETARRNAPILDHSCPGKPDWETKMRFEYGKAYGWVVEELAQSRPIAQAMESLIAQCEAAYPHPDWERLRTLPYADLSPLVEWILRVFREEASEQPLQGLW